MADQHGATGREFKAAADDLRDGSVQLGNLTPQDFEELGLPGVDGNTLEQLVQSEADSYDRNRYLLRLIGTT